MSEPLTAKDIEDIETRFWCNEMRATDIERLVSEIERLRDQNAELVAGLQQVRLLGAMGEFRAASIAKAVLDETRAGTQ